MLTCQQVTELVTDYIERRQSLSERVRFELHLGLCRHCRAYLRQMKGTVEALGSPRKESVPPEMSRQVLDRFRNWKG